MFRIMEIKEKGIDYTSTYVFKTHNVDGVILPIEFETLAELDSYVEDLLNNKGYAKSDFIIVEVKDYNVFADIAENNQSNNANENEEQQNQDQNNA